MKNQDLHTDQGDQRAARKVQQPPAAPVVEEQTKMDRYEVTDRRKPEANEKEVPTSPSATNEKPRAPLTNLKTKFEKREDGNGKVSLYQLICFCQYIYLHYLKG
ncbi:hypothetical protein XENORESO_016015 [Xenotaenia resolanae]|uniref:Uncharacterized protein n=1 Tax=Xenotaenia resolanae TaxID=208358 RepID=A0ABV0WRA3_9TELE